LKTRAPFSLASSGMKVMNGRGIPSARTAEIVIGGGDESGVYFDRLCPSDSFEFTFISGFFLLMQFFSS